MSTSTTQTAKVPWFPPQPERVRPGVACTDDRLRLQLEPGGALRISGVASGEGDAGAGSEVRLSFEGAQVCVALREGMTPGQTFRMLEKVMPLGYRLDPVLHADHEVRCELLRTA